MAPKPKKVKKTKAQLEEERLLAEEAERKAKELEDKRLAEEAEKRRLEDLRIAAERVAFRQAEISRLVDEYNQMEDDRQSREYQMNVEESREFSKLDWLKYKDPTDEPDPSSEKDLNTFFSQVTENDVQSLQDAFILTKKIEQVARAVEFIWADSIANQNNRIRELTESYMKQFSSLVMDKLDTATAHLLRFTDEHINDHKELQVQDGSGKHFLGLWATYQDPRPSRRPVEFDKLGVRLEFPKNVLQHDGHFIHRVIRMPIETLSYSAYHPDAGRSDFPWETDKYVVGDLLIIDILRPPPGSFVIRAKRWTVRDKSVPSMKIQKNVYPSTNTYKCFMHIPDEIFMSEDTTMAAWNEAERRWTDEGIQSFQYLEATRQVEFATTAVGLFALVKNRNAEMPYKFWSLRPVRTPSQIIDPSSAPKLPESFERHARLTVQTQTQEIVIDIVGTKCRLLEPNVKQVKDLIGVDMSPGALLHTLQRRGVNLLPAASDADRCNGLKKPTKNSVLELTVLSEMARCAGAVDFQCTPWNQVLGEDQVAVLAKETSAYTGTGEDFDFEAVLGEIDSKSLSFQNAPKEGGLPGAGVKFTLVMGNEYGTKAEYSERPRPGEITHLSLSETIARRVMPEVLQRIERTNVRFQKTVLIVLRLLRPLSMN